MKKEGGFTLIEMVIVIGVMAIISSIMIAYNRTSEQKIAIFSDGAKVVGVLQRAKSFALEKRGNACAFGVHFEKPRTMIIFGDLPTSGERCVEGNFDKAYDKSDDKEMETISLDERIEFSVLPSGGNSYDVVFVPPYLETSGVGIIEIKTLDDSKNSCIEIGAGGQIYNDNDCSGI